ncbi:SIS domain-containing protein [Microbacterium tumbae]
MNGYITFVSARLTQAEQLAAVLPRLRERIGTLGSLGVLQGTGPVFTGIGASLAAAAGGVWRLRERGHDAWRLAAGDNPIPLPESDALIFGVSQSGRSTETIAALESVPPHRRAAVVNRAESPIGVLAEHVVDFGDVPDSYASTLGYTATAMAVALIAEAWDGGAADPTWESLPGVLVETRERLAATVADGARLFAGATSADFAAEGPSAGSAEVGALLFREVARVPSTGFGTRQYLHGAMESAGDGVHVLVGGAREAAAADMLADAGHRVIFLTDAAAPVSSKVVTLPLPSVSATQRPLVEAVILQDLVEAVADIRDVRIEEFVFHHTDTKIAAGEDV